MRRNCHPRANTIARAGTLVSVLGAALLASSSANAIATFTWSPSGGGLSNATPFSANNITIKDYAQIHLPADPTVIGSINEAGALAFTSFSGLTGTLKGFVPGTGNPADAISGATAYQLYIKFTSTSHLNAGVGQFDSLSYAFWGDAGGNCNFSSSGSFVSGCLSDTQVKLADGVLSSTGLNQVTLIGGIPTANVQLTFNELVPGFFVAPPPSITLQMEGSFINTPGALSNNCGGVFKNCTVKITAGGGNLDFVGNVPEPGTLWLLGAGLLGMAGLGRRMRARARD